MKKLYAGFYFRDVGAVRFGEIEIDPKNATVKFFIDGEAVNVDQRRIVIAEPPR